MLVIDFSGPDEETVFLPQRQMVSWLQRRPRRISPSQKSGYLQATPGQLEMEERRGCSLSFRKVFPFWCERPSTPSAGLPAVAHSRVTAPKPPAPLPPLPTPHRGDHCPELSERCLLWLTSTLYK